MIQPSWLVISCILFSSFEKWSDLSDALITRRRRRSLQRQRFCRALQQACVAAPGPRDGAWRGRQRAGTAAGMATVGSCPHGTLHPRSAAGQDRITESQNGGGWQDPLWVTQPNPLPKQGHPEQAAQHRSQAGLEYLQRRRLHSLPGQPGPGLRHPQKEEVLPRVQLELPLLQFVPVAPCPDVLGQRDAVGCSSGDAESSHGVSRRGTAALPGRLRLRHGHTLCFNLFLVTSLLSLFSSPGQSERDVGAAQRETREDTKLGSSCREAAGGEHVLGNAIAAYSHT